ncbi:endonuclease/exonuclease/phosphatase family protein [Flammeovirga sp. OC4]|uniref:endonuclease/exonuclease/phosphatase family protein n=1 Tax=Flammeovirga sp. OC4 TaxID=1382345 RepID=UPI0005C57A4D|nr:endonuclease/exonuclease/phosphatase family protein [Flammeovirga sp. OC4]
MKQIQLFFLLFFTAFSSLFAQEVTIATFNAEFLNKKKVQLKFGLPYDMKYASKKEQKFWDKEENRSEKLQEASANVAEMIKKINADIITLTEVGTREDLEVLVDELKKIEVTYDYWEVCDSKDTFTGQHVAVLSKYPLKDTWYEIEGTSIYLEELDGDAEGQTGISKGMKVTATIEGKEVDIFVLHFKSERGGFESDAKRIAQASIARRAIIKQLNLGRRVIVTGDLNAEKKSPSVYRVRGFDDIYEELIQTGRSEYFKDFDVRWTYNYKGEPEQIDHILFSSNIANEKDIHTKIIKTDNELVSDHNPVIVNFKLK